MEQNLLMSATESASFARGEPLKRGGILRGVSVYEPQPKRFIFLVVPSPLQLTPPVSRNVAALSGTLRVLTDR